MGKAIKYFLMMIGLAGIAVAITVAMLREPAPLKAVNSLLDSDSQLSAYAYQFEVLSLENGVATVMTPRSAQVSALRFVYILYPDLADYPATHPDVTKATREFNELHSRVQHLVSSHNAVRQVKWQLDKEWYAKQGVGVQ